MRINIDYNDITWELDEDCNLSEGLVWNCVHEYAWVEDNIDGTFVYCSNPECSGMSEEFEFDKIESYFDSEDNYGWDNN